MPDFNIADYFGSLFVLIGSLMATPYITIVPDVLISVLFVIPLILIILIYKFQQFLAKKGLEIYFLSALAGISGFFTVNYLFQKGFFFFIGILSSLLIIITMSKVVEMVVNANRSSY